MEEQRQPHKNTFRRVKIEKELLKDKTLSAMEIAILFKLITCLDDFKPTISIMAKILHTSPKSIRTATDKLQAKGYLKIILTPMKKRNIWKVSQTREFLKENQEESTNK